MGDHVSQADGKAHPPVSGMVMGHDAEAVLQGVGNDVVAKMGVGLGVGAGAMPVEELDQDVPLEHVDAHAGLEGVLRGRVLAHALQLLHPLRAWLLLKVCHHACTSNIYANHCRLRCTSILISITVEKACFKHQPQGHRVSSP